MSAHQYSAAVGVDTSEIRHLFASFFNGGNSSSCRFMCGTLALPTATPSLLLLFAHHRQLLPPSLKFCLTRRHCPFLAQSSGRERERGENLYQSSGAPFVVSVPSIHPVSKGAATKGPGNPIGISLPLLPVKICSSSEEFCWHLTACVWGFAN